MNKCEAVKGKKEEMRFEMVTYIMYVFRKKGTKHPLRLEIGQ